MRARIVVIYEAGRDGFLIQRALQALGYEVLKADPASIPVERRAKTGRLDAIKLVGQPAGLVARRAPPGVGAVLAELRQPPPGWLIRGPSPKPYDSGESRVDQGISKQCNWRVLASLIEMGWFWLRYQPDGALAKWFVQRTQGSVRTSAANASPSWWRPDGWRLLCGGI